MSSMLTPGKADFQDLTDDNNLYVQKVIQKAYIDVNEQGTEAAAATGKFSYLFQCFFFVRNN